MTPYFTSSRSTPSASRSSSGPTAKLKWRSRCAFALVAVLLVCHQFLLQPVLLRLNTDGPVINVAGRQRMLSQKLAKAALALQASAHQTEFIRRRDELAAVVEEWARAHRGLQFGDQNLRLPPSSDPEILAAYRALEPHVQAILSASRVLLQADPQRQVLTDAQVSAIRQILAHEETFLSQMHQLVGLHAAAAQARVSQLQALGWGIVGTILALLLIIQTLLIRPAVNVVGTRLAAWEAQYHRLVESMSEGLVVHDAQGTIQLANHRFCELVGCHQDDVLDQRATQFMADTDRSRYAGIIADDSQPIAPFELALQGSGGVVETMASLQSLRDPGGGSEEFLLVVTDVTAYKQAEARSHRLQEQLNHANRLKSIGELAAGLAHELNQPLAAIANYTEACLANLRETPLDVETLRRPLERILSAALRGGEVVRRARRFSQRVPHEFRRESLHDLIREVEQLYRYDALRNEVAMEFDLSTDLSLLPLDGIQIQQVLANLIQNAFTAMESTDPSRRHLRISTELESPEFVRVEVRDTGKGLAGADVERLFEPFFTTSSGGLGLGLAIAQSIVEAHGGTLGAIDNDSPDGGATFHFTLATHASDTRSEWSAIKDEVANV